MNILVKLGLLTLTVFIMSCSLGPVNTGPTTTYLLNTVPHVAKKSKTYKILLVMPPETNSIYDTNKMAYTLYPYQLAYYAKNGWAAAPSNMLYPLIVQTLQNTNYFRAVSTNMLWGRYHYILNTRLERLQQNFIGNYSEVELVLRAQLVDASTRKLIAAKMFKVTEPAPQNNPYGGVVAANRATATMLSQLARFCVNSVAH